MTHALPDLRSIRRRDLAAAPLALAALLAVGGCMGHGTHTAEGIANARERLAGFKSGVEWDMARQQFLAGDLEKALRTIDRSIALNESVAKSHVLRARILMEMGRLEDAGVSLAKARAIDPRHVDAYYYDGVLRERLSDREGALQRYLAAGEIDEANPQYLVAAAEMLIETGRVAQAEQLLLSRLPRFEHNVGVRQVLAQVARLSGDPERSADMLHQARLLAPDDMTVLEDLARAQTDAGRYADAEYNLRRVIEAAAPKRRRDLEHLRARCLLSLGRPLESRDILLGLTRDAEGASDTAAWSELGRVALRLQDQSNVRLAANRLRTLAPNSAESDLLLASLRRAQGDLAGALDLCDRAARAYPDDHDVLLLRGLILAHMGRRDESAQSLARAVSLSPDDARARALLSAVESGAETGER